MAKSKKLDLDNPPPVVDDEDEEILAAIDEGMRDAKAGRTVPAEEIRCLLQKILDSFHLRASVVKTILITQHYLCAPCAPCG